MSAQRAAQLVEAGLWLRLSGDQEGARRLFEQALRLEPGNARARQLLEAAPAPGPAPAAPGPDPFQRPVAPPVSPVSDMDWGLETGMAPEASPPVPSPELPPEYQQPGGGSGSSTLVFGITAPPPPPPPVPPAAAPPPVQAAAQPWGQVPFETEELTWDESAVPTAPAVPVVPAPAAVSGGTMMFSGGLPPVSAPVATSGSTMMFSGGAAPVIPPLVPAPPAPAAGGGTMLFPASAAPAIPPVAPPPPPAAGGGTMLFPSGPPAPPVEELVEEELELSVDEAPLAVPPPPPPAAGGGTMLFSGGAELVPPLGVPAPPPDEATTEAMDLDLTFDEPMPRPPPSSPALAADATSAWDKRSNPGITITKTDPGMGKALDLVDPPPVPSAPTARRENELEVLLRGARDLLELDDHSGAMELILKAQAVAPEHPEVKALKERSERTLQTMYESKLGPLAGTPRVRLKDDEIIWLNLDHRAGFVLAQIDGSMTFEDVFAVSGMSRLDTARILAQLLEEGVIVR